MKKELQMSNNVKHFAPIKLKRSFFTSKKMTSLCSKPWNSFRPKQNLTKWVTWQSQTIFVTKSQSRLTSPAAAIFFISLVSVKNLNLPNFHLAFCLPSPSLIIFRNKFNLIFSRDDPQDLCLSSAHFACIKDAESRSSLRFCLVIASFLCN